MLIDPKRMPALLDDAASILRHEGRELPAIRVEAAAEYLRNLPCPWKVAYLALCAANGSEPRK